MAEAFRVPAELVGGKQEREEVARNVEEVLAWLDDCDTRGTFFVLGRIAKQQPDVVRSIAQAGHEIGSHSFHHLRLYNQDPAGLREAISASRQALEDAAGVPVLGFRAPDFSINAETLHILDQILEAGYTYDSSIFPIEGHDVYGVPGAQREIHRLGNGLVEFPPATVRMLGRTLPVLGGGYFRLLPLSASQAHPPPQAR